jgi:putative transposase
VLTDGSGVPLGVAVAGANEHDKWLVGETLRSQPVVGPEPMAEAPQHPCGDKGYDYADVRAVVDLWGYTAHVRARGEEAREKAEVPGYRARRWVVERTPSWMNRFRRLLIRWEKKSANYLAFIHLACACITYRAAGLLG